MIDLGLAAHGFATEKTLCYFRRDARVRAEIRKRLAKQADAGALTVRRMPSGERLFARPGAFDQPLRRLPEVVRILSPFDNAVIQRRRGVAVFDFDYTIECYTPEAKRRFGYFALPLVFRDRFVGRMDCKAHRAEGRFEIKALFLEGAATEECLPALAAAVNEYAAFTGCNQVEMQQMQQAQQAQRAQRALPQAFAGRLQRLFG